MRPAGTRTAEGPPDMYDRLDAARGPELRRANLERLALLEVDGSARRARLAVAGVDLAGLRAAH